jgi:gliding motility-associated-like protein
LKKSYIIFFSLLLNVVLFAQPANDDCSNAQVITLPTPAACPDGDGATVSISGTTIGATASNPYLYLTGCSGGGNQQAPALDVWYSFVATGTLLHLNLNSIFSMPNIALWTGSCTNLIGVECAIGKNAGVLNYTNTELSPGATYFIQISGNTSTAQGNFNFTIDNDMDCNSCVMSASFTATPAPVNGTTYLAGQTVQVCFTINGFNQASLNWLHGIEYTFGPGWDLSTLTTGTPAECNANPPGPSNASGTWKWFNSVTQSVSPFNVHGPGYFFESNDDAETTNAGNNFGDYTAGACTWTFCITLKVSSTCISGQSLNITVNTLGDGESGSWTSPACLGDPNFTFNATMSCCPAASSATLTQPTCSTPTGTITINTPAPAAGISYSIDGINYTNTNGIFTGLVPNTYNVTVKNASGCISTATIYTINSVPSAPSAPAATLTQPTCTTPTGTITINTPAPAAGISYSIDGINYTNTNGIFTGLVPNTYNVTVKNASGCISITTTFTVNNVSSTPLLVIINPTPVCQPTTVDLTSPAITFGSEANLNYSYWVDATATVPLTNPTTISNSGTYYITGKSITGCSITKPVIVAIANKIDGIRYPTVTAAPNVPLSLLARTLGNNYSYQWIPPDGLNDPTIKDPIFTYDKKTGYTIKITSDIGCITVDTLLVDLINTAYVFVPNAWTPNGDGHNDYLFPLTANITQLKYFRIFNRWGQKVFETTSIGRGWDGMFQGKPMPMDVYTWTIEAISTDGNNYQRIGKAVLLR